jgi:low affinity Fe/Cu permease
MILTAYASILGLFMLYYHAIDSNLFYAHFINKTTGEVFESGYITVIKYLINKYYAFFAAIVLMATIAITLFLFLSYHLTLISQNLTTNEKSKRSKMIKYMNLIKDTLVQVGKHKEITLKKEKIELSKEEIENYKHIIFHGNYLLTLEPEFDLSTLSEEGINKFYHFADIALHMFKKNTYYIGFWPYLKNIINGI